MPRTDWLVYRVVQGDTLGTIAQRTNSTAQALVNANCLSNPNQISVGQSIYVPQLPSSPPAGRTGTLGLTISSYLSSDGSAYSFALNSTTTIIVTNVPTGARSVDFYIRPTGTGIDSGNLIGTDNNLADGASLQLTTSRGLLGHINAEAKDPSGAVLASSDFILVYVEDVPVGIPSSPFEISPFVVSEGDQFQLQRGAVVTIRVSSPPPNAELVRFFFSPTGTGSTVALIGSDENMADGVSVSWTVPTGSFSGHIEGEAVVGGVATSIGTVTVFAGQ
jgi:murein DD-endopeptidase MepM/ murein hydrolase activator NlpD